MHKELSILTIEHPAERLALRWLLIALSMLILAYLYFVAASVLNVIERKEALAQAARLESSIGSLEQRYLSLSQSLDGKAGSVLGLAPVSHTAYVRRPGTVGMAGAAHNEI